jgi:hypothetical protein
MPRSTDSSGRARGPIDDLVRDRQHLEHALRAAAAPCSTRFTLLSRRIGS